MLSIDSLHVSYGGVQAVRGISMEVPDGKVVAVLGSNGAGKTTLLRAISGTLRLHRGRVESGSLRFGDAELGSRDPADSVRMGLVLVPEGRRFFGRLTVEDAYAYAKFARVVLNTNDIDFRARVHTAEEADFVARLAGTGLGVTYSDLENAPAVLLAGLDPEEEAPTVFLRLRKAVRKKGTTVFAVAPFASRGLSKVAAEMVMAVPGTEAEVLTAVADGDQQVRDVSDALSGAGAVVLVGERLAGVPGALSAAGRLAETTGARLAWIPRRAGR